MLFDGEIEIAGEYRSSFGLWNVHEGADPFGQTVRDSIDFNKKLGSDSVQVHDEDAVVNINDLAPEQIITGAEALKAKLDEHGLTAEFVAPRLWEDPRTIDGGHTANDPKFRQYALDRSKRAINIADALGTDLIILWLAREGRHIREAKNSKVAVDRYETFRRIIDQ